jgi:anti-sigma B factor antagonist
MATPLELSTRHDGDGTLVVSAVGEIDMSNVDQFRAALREAAAALGEAAGASGDRFVVDLTGVDYLDSAGIHALYTVVPRVRLVASPLLSPVLDISGLLGITSVRQQQD